MFLKTRDQVVFENFDKELDSVVNEYQLKTIFMKIQQSDLNENLLSTLLNKVNYVKNMMFKRYDKSEIKKDAKSFVFEMVKQNLNYTQIKELLKNFEIHSTNFNKSSIIFKYYDNEDKYIFSKFKMAVVNFMERNIYNNIRIGLITSLTGTYNKLNKFFDE